MKKETSVKPWWKSRTMIVAVVMAVSGILATVETEYKLPGILLTVKALLDMWLRLNTSERVE